MTLKTKLIVGGVVAAILPLVVVGVFSITKSSTALVSIAEGQAKLTAQNLATMVDLSMKQEVGKAEAMASAFSTSCFMERSTMVARFCAVSIA